MTAEQETTIHKHSLHIKRDDELTVMRTSHADKLARLREPGGDLDKFSDPNGRAAVRWELKKQGLRPSEVNQELVDQQAYYTWKEAILDEIVAHIDLEVRARRTNTVIRIPQ